MAAFWPIGTARIIDPPHILCFFKIDPPKSSLVENRTPPPKPLPLSPWDVINNRCLNTDLSAIARVTSRRTSFSCRLSSQYPSLVNSLSYGSNKKVCAPSHSDELELLFVLSFEGRKEREELSQLQDDLYVEISYKFTLDEVI